MDLPHCSRTILSISVYALLEWYLGRTKRVPQNSLLELMAAGILFVVGALAMKLLPSKKP
jgi:hypothetical protein